MITPDQIKAARKLLGWSAVKLAKKAARSLTRVVAAEASTLPPEHEAAVLKSIRAAIEAAGVVFVNAGVRLAERPQPVPTAITAVQIQEARRQLGWSLTTLAEKAGMGLPTVRKVETSALVPRNAERQLAAIRTAFEAAGIDFTDGRVTIKFRTGEASVPRMMKEG